MDQELEQKIVTRGKSFFASISRETPSIFSKSYWIDKIMDWSMKNETFKVRMFRFVDVMPYLNTPESLNRHIHEYFADVGENAPKVLRWSTKLAGSGSLIRSNIETMGRQYIIGRNVKEAIKGLSALRKDGFTFTIDLLGEASVNEEESEAYARGYHEVLDALTVAQHDWPPLSLREPFPNGDPNLDWGYMPRINLSIKPSALYSQVRPVALDDSVSGIYRRLAPLYKKVIETGAFLCIDMEQFKYKEMTIELFKRLRSAQEFRHYPYLCLVQQAYLRSCEDDIRDLIAWSKRESLPIALRLVKGAYWDVETVAAKQCDRPVPVWARKPETDICYERCARLILENHQQIYFACASHNVRTLSAIMEIARELHVPEHRYEFQILYGMGDPVRKGLKNIAGKVRLYCPYGELIPGMAYLVRRLLENTANESFLRRSFVDGATITLLLENPAITLERENATRRQQEAEKGSKASSTARSEDVFGPFSNEPLIDFTVPGHRDAYADAIRQMHDTAGRTLPLYINGKDVETEVTLPTMNPADPDEILAHVCQAGVLEVNLALAAAKTVMPVWRDTPALERATYLRKAAAVARRRIFEFSALQTLEVGKQWDQAYHDVAEGIDFLEYYARDMLRLNFPRRMGRAPGEHNTLLYQSRGIAAVIAPWNFPFAIAMGMVSAAIVTGNPVIFKPSSLASAIGYTLNEIWKEVGLPPGVFNYCPGRSSVIGDYLVEHRDITIIGFTGSMEVGQHIMEKAAKVQPGQRQVKRVIAEMGGKNAIIVDDDADLDEAVAQIIQSAFGFQGQKCSACSRVIVLDSIYDIFIRRLTLAAESIKIGPSEFPENFMGPLADASLVRNVVEYGEVAAREGNLLVKRVDYPDKGAYAPLVIVDGITPEHRIAQEEVFGPVLVVMRAGNFDQALELALSTRFALTGAVFSRSPVNLLKAREHFRVGNLYLNRGSTGAMVERQPFGGFLMSGVGSKTGGPDYLLQYLDPRCVTENTIRRGFTPDAGDDDRSGPGYSLPTGIVSH